LTVVNGGRFDGGRAYERGDEIMSATVFRVVFPTLFGAICLICLAVAMAKFSRPVDDMLSGVVPTTPVVDSAGSDS